MNNKTEYIDKLFAEARKEPLILDDAGIAEILRNAASQPIVPTKGIVPRKFVSALSTKTIFISAAAAIVILAGATHLAFREQSASFVPSNSQFADMPAPSEQATGQAILAPTNQTRTKTMQTRIWANRNVDRNTTSTTNDESSDIAAAVKGVNIIDLSTNEIAALGIDNTSDKIVFFAAKNDAFDVKVTLANDIVDIRNTNHTATQALMPKFVTDRVGNRKLSLISNNNVNLIKTYSVDEDNHRGKPTLANVYISNFDKSDAPDNHAGIGFSIYRQRRNIYSQQGSNVNFSFTAGSNADESYNISFNIDSLFDAIISSLGNEFDNAYGRSRSGRMSLATILRNIRDDYNNDQIDTIEIATESETKNGSDEVIAPADFQDLKYKLDSLRIALNSYNYMINLNASVRGIDFQSIFNTARQGNSDNFKYKYTTSANTMRTWQYQTDSLMSEMEAIENELDAYLRVNKLVPLAVSDARGTHSYIFWYEPTPELIDKLPERYRSVLEPELVALKNSLLDCRLAPHPGADSYFDVWRACSGAIENLSISPNPVKSVLTASYNLTAERNCTVALHDLRGNLVSVLGAMQTKPAAQISEQFPVSGVTPGLYLLVVTTENGEQAVQRVIIE